MRRGDPPDRVRVDVPGIEDRRRPDEDVGEDRRDEAHGDDVAELPARAEPLRRGQRLDDRRPHQAAAGEEEEVLERVHGAVVERGLVEDGEVPDVEVDRPERQRDERVGQDAQPLDRLQREHGPQHRPREPRDEAERREVAEEDVLAHVDEEEVLLAELVDRRVERDHDERDPEPEHELPPTRHRAPAPGEVARPPQVEERRRRSSARAGAARGSRSWRRRRSPLKCSCVAERAGRRRCTRLLRAADDRSLEP